MKISQSQIDFNVSARDPLLAIDLQSSWEFYFLTITIFLDIKEIPAESSILIFLNIWRGFWSANGRRFLNNTRVSIDERLKLKILKLLKGLLVLLI